VSVGRAFADADTAASSALVGARVKRVGAAQTGTTSVWLLALWDGEDYDSGGIHDNAVNPSRLTAPSDGYYLVQAQTSWATSAVGVRQTMLRINAAGNTALGTSLMQQGPWAGVTGGFQYTMSTVCRLVAGDYVELFTWHNHGANLGANGTIATDFFAITRLAV
jgi:hypothetical protein